MYIKLDAVTKVKTSFSISFTKLPSQKGTVKDMEINLCHSANYLFPYQSFPSSLTINGMRSLFLHLLSSWGLTDALTNVHGIQYNELLCYFLEQRILQSTPST